MNTNELTYVILNTGFVETISIDDFDMRDRDIFANMISYMISADGASADLSIGDEDYIIRAGKTSKGDLVVYVCRDIYGLECIAARAVIGGIGGDSRGAWHALRAMAEGDSAQPLTPIEKMPEGLWCAIHLSGHYIARFGGLDEKQFLHVFNLVGALAFIWSEMSRKGLDHFDCSALFSPLNEIPDIDDLAN